MYETGKIQCGSEDGYLFLVYRWTSDGQQVLTFEQSEVKLRIYVGNVFVRMRLNVEDQVFVHKKLI